MLSRQLRFLTLALVLGASAAHGQGDSKLVSKGGSVALKPSFVALVDTQDALAAQFRRLSIAATGANAQVADRKALARFVRKEIVPQLTSESLVLFTAFDSVTGGGYAVPATLFDLDAIDFLVKEIERTSQRGDRGAFEQHSYALSLALEGYFTKVQLLVLPVLNQQLSGAALSGVLARLEDGRTTP